MYTTKQIARAGMVAALYALITLILMPISFGKIQFRVSEALTLLPVLLPEAVPGLAVGCCVANLLGGSPWYDVVFGTLATLLSAIATRRLRHQPLLAALPPVAFNGIIVGVVVYFAALHVPSAPIAWTALLSCMGLVAVGEACVCYSLGLGLIKLLSARHIL